MLQIRPVLRIHAELYELCPRKLRCAACVHEQEPVLFTEGVQALEERFLRLAASHVSILNNVSSRNFSMSA